MSTKAQVRRRKQVLRFQHPWRKDCPSGKLLYRSDLEAAMSAAQNTRRGSPQRFYKCDDCVGFHTTHLRAAR